MYQSLQDAALTMIEAAERGRAVLPLLRKLCPQVYRQITDDGKHPRLLTVWGRSLNVDENTGETIVHPAILEAIGKLARVRMAGRIVHAGLQHTYGYLFSTIQTPYGRKRDRWVSASMEDGFGLERSLLGASPRRGTLLGNLTAFLGRIVFQDESRRMRLLEQFVDYVDPEIAHYPYQSLQSQRILEETNIPGSDRPLSVTTTLVRYPHSPADSTSENSLLIYSLQVGAGNPSKLITAFPARQATVDELTQAPARGRKASIRLRYNAYFPGMSGCIVLGRRRLLE